MAIAMLATALLGVVLLLILRAYYGGQEISYLKSNARSISSSLGILVEVGAGADVLRAQVRTLGFLSQTRVRVLDRDGVELADSGDPRRLNETVTISFGSAAFPRRLPRPRRGRRWSSSSARRSK